MKADFRPEKDGSFLIQPKETNFLGARGSLSSGALPPIAGFMQRWRHDLPYDQKF
jgi:hypothetical protein